MAGIHADIEALKEFHGALARFRSAQLEVAARAGTEIEVARARLEAKASRLRANLEQSRAENAGTVGETEQQLEVIRHWQYRIDQEASEFRDADGRFRNLLESDLPRAEAGLLAAIASLESARRVHGGGS